MRTQHEVRMRFHLDGDGDDRLHHETAVELATDGADTMIEHYRADNKVGNDGPAVCHEVIQLRVQRVDGTSPRQAGAEETDAEVRRELWDEIDDAIASHHLGAGIEAVIGRLVEARRDHRREAPRPVPGA